MVDTMMVDPAHQQRILHIVQGQIGATSDPDVVYTAIIGAGVVVCLWDPAAKRGGAAHFLFPEGEIYGPKETRFGHQAIVTLIGQIVGLGGDATRLEARLFGGAKMHDGRRDIGKRNADFVMTCLARKNIPIVARGLGGGQVRRIRFCPTTGEATEQILDHGMPHETLASFGSSAPD